MKKNKMRGVTKICLVRLAPHSEKGDFALQSTKDVRVNKLRFTNF